MRMSDQNATKKRAEHPDPPFGARFVGCQVSSILLCRVACGGGEIKRGVSRGRSSTSDAHEATSCFRSARPFPAGRPNASLAKDQCSLDPLC